MVATGLYNGFSTKQFVRTKTFRVSDFELVREDLLNHIYTRRGERVMLPQFGTRIPEMVFEPLDEITIEVIRDDLRAVFDFDPRVRTLDLKVIPDYDTNSINVLAELYYVELDTVNTFDLNIVFETA